MNGREEESSLRPAVLVIALPLLVLGVLGFFYLPENNQAGQNTFWIFNAAGLLDIIRTASGVLGLAAVLKPSAIPAYGWVSFVAFAGLTAFGVLSAATTLSGDTINFGWADNVFHALVSLAGLTVAVVVTRRTKRNQAEARTDV
jgi:hypothetical protein